MDGERAVVLLRAVNVGGTGTLRMAAFEACLTSAGCTDARTVLQSGNAVVRVASPVSSIERPIHDALLKQAGVDADVFVRAAGEWQALVHANPFVLEAETQPSRLVAMVVRETPASADVARLRASMTGPERLTVGDRVLYIFYPDGQGRSKLTGATIERALGTRGTARNWNTVTKLLTLVTARATA